MGKTPGPTITTSSSGDDWDKLAEQGFLIGRSAQRTLYSGALSRRRGLRSMGKISTQAARAMNIATSLS